MSNIEVTPDMLAAAWASWREKWPALRLRDTGPDPKPVPGFREAIEAALNARAETDVVDALRAEVAKLTRERDDARQHGLEARLREKASEDARVSAVDKASSVADPVISEGRPPRRKEKR